MTEPRSSPDDRVAVGWAWTSRSPTGQVLRERQEQELDPAPTSDELLAIREEWESAGRPVPEHHVHRSAVELPDGTTLVAVSFHPDDPYTREAAPSFGLYLDERWDPPWLHEHLAWVDFGVPDPIELASALERLLQRARGGDLVEMGCLGGHGRTGTALSCLAVLTGVPGDEAVAWARANYCPDAVETNEQRAFVERFGP